MVCIRLPRYRFVKRILLLVFISVLLILYFSSRNLLYTATNYILDFEEKCKDGLAREFIHELCLNYSKGLSYGNLCNPLCEKDEIHIDGCISHGSTIVLHAKWRHKHIVLKKKKEHSLPQLETLAKDVSKKGLVGDTKDLSEQLSRSVLSQLFTIFGYSTIQSLKEGEKKLILRNLLFGKELAQMTFPEIASHLKIIGQDEYLIFAVFKSMNHFPQLLGFCGLVYAMEKLTPLNRINYNALSWGTRAKLALDFIDLIQDFEKTKTGALSHCDVQESNFGVTDAFKVKAIDVDLVFTEERMNEILPQPKCSSSEECDFFDCMSLCDVTKNKCTKKRITNNLQVLCRDIFAARKLEQGLLENPPVQIYEKLNSLLKFCSLHYFGYVTMNSKQVQNMIKELKLVLTWNTESL